MPSNLEHRPWGSMPPVPVLINLTALPTLSSTDLVYLPIRQTSENSCIPDFQTSTPSKITNGTARRNEACISLSLFENTTYRNQNTITPRAINRQSLAIEDPGKCPDLFFNIPSSKPKAVPQSSHQTIKRMDQIVGYSVFGVRSDGASRILLLFSNQNAVKSYVLHVCLGVGGRGSFPPKSIARCQVKPQRIRIQRYQMTVINAMMIKQMSLISPYI